MTASLAIASKEQVYNAKISPLVDDLTATCKDYNIAMLASFSISTEESPGLMCLTSTADETGNVPPIHAAAIETMRRGPLAPEAEAAGENNPLISAAVRAIKKTVVQMGFEKLDLMLQRAKRLADGTLKSDPAGPDLSQTLKEAGVLVELMAKAIASDE